VISSWERTHASDVRSRAKHAPTTPPVSWHEACCVERKDKEGDAMPVKKLKDFLDGHGTKYITIRHSRAYTAQETAQSAHIPGRKLAKTVMVKVDGKMAMVVVRGPDHVNLGDLKRAIGAAKVELATEAEFKRLFPDCEIGAMPPFGNLYDMEVFASSKLAEDDEIAFNAGSHTELIQLAYADFARLVSPKVVNL
jgi:Ala-tRNA(Pro) deacylase